MRFHLSVSDSPPRTPGQRVGALIAALFCVGSGAFAAWIAITGPRIAGGFALLPDAVNQGVGRAVFGVSSLILFGLAWLAMRDTRATPASRSDDERR